MGYYFIILSLALLSTFLYIGYQSSKKITNNEGYFLAGRSLGIFTASISLVATQLGAGVILGTSYASYQYGIYGILYPLGISLGMVAIAIFGAKQLREKNIFTISELFEKEYQSRFLRKLSSMISIVSLYGILISLIIATKKILFAFGIHNQFILYIFWIVLILYTVLGGFKAVVYTDIVQIIFIFFTFIIIAIYYTFNKYEYIQFSLDNLFCTIHNKNHYSCVHYMIVPFLYVFIEQDMAQIFFSTKNSKIAYTSAFIAGLLLLLFSFLPLIFGIAARSIQGIPIGSSEMIFFFISTSNSFIISIAVLAVLCAIISTGDSLLCAITSNLALDFQQDGLPSNLLKVRFIAILLGLVGIIIAKYFDDIVEVMLLSYEIMICTLFFPILSSYFKFKKSTAFAYIAVFLGVIGFVIHSIFSTGIFLNISKELFCISLSFFSFPLSYIYNNFNKTRVI